MTAGLITIAASVLLAVAIGGWRAYVDGRFRRHSEVEVRAQRASRPRDQTADLGPLLPADRLGERATLLQFSSAFCAPCRAARRVLSEVAEVVPGVAHVELDAEGHLDLVRRVGVLRTPTTLVLDSRGLEVTRAAGAPSKAQVLAALAQVGD